MPRAVEIALPSSAIEGGAADTAFIAEVDSRAHL